MKDNLDPKGQSRSRWNSTNGRFPFNNRGFAVVAGDSNDSNDGDDDGGDNNNAGAGGAATLTDNWRDKLDPTIKDHPALQNFKTPYDVAKSYVEVQKLVGKEKIPVPNRDSDPNNPDSKDWGMVFDRLGRPSDPKSYVLPEVQFPENFPRPSDETITEFKSFAHKLGLLPHQVAALYKWDSERGINILKQHGEQQEVARQDSESKLRKEYGVAFDANLSQARGLLKKFGDNDLLEVLDSSGLGNHPAVVKFMVKVAKNFGEDGHVLSGETQSDVMTPDEAKSEISKIRSDKNHPYHETQRDHPEHKNAIKRMSQLYAMAYPEKK